LETVQNESGRDVKRNTEFYNLDAIIAVGEYEKYKPIQDRLFESDFDKEIKKLLKGK
jgi:hypothetical protein